jgi:hypothetical protein
MMRRLRPWAERENLFKYSISDAGVIAEGGEVDAGGLCMEETKKRLHAAPFTISCFK